ncbi:MAG TPA: DCC1-like thiol-disulfide oxidoreductase family protein [Kofleriaceae bacterium]|jgi:predicted DCC family thiol-disulfide oxidoreductase YuxK
MVTARTPDAAARGPLVLYDGTCGLCAKSVQWILRHERDHDIRFAPLQGETTEALRAAYPTIPSHVDTVIYIDGGKAYLRSRAFLHLSKHLHAPYSWGYAFRWFPAFLMNVGYRFVAAIRYRVWGRVDSCGLMTPEQRARFLP